MAGKPGQPAVVDASAWGYPIRSLKDVPAGEYTVQAVLNKYETFHRADGKTVKLHMDQGEGQLWNISPGNLISKPHEDHRQAGRRAIYIALTEVIPPIATPADTKYIRHIRIQSALLTKFWGRPMFLSAIVLVPEGFDEHPNAHFPLMVFHDHFVDGFDDFRTTPPDPNLKPDYSERFHLAGYNRIQQQEAYKFYQQWIAPGFPRFLIVKIQHANPYYDDSYAVNSANVGPYGDAIETELIPAIEKQFRAIGQGWARFTYGGSTGGWEALAVQVFYPDHYNGAFAACPDPIDFHAFTNIDLYNDKNAFLSGRRAQARGAAGDARLPGPHLHHHRGDQRLRTGAGRSWPQRRAVRHLAGGLRAGGRGRLSAADLRQGDRRDRSQCGRSTGASTMTWRRFWSGIGRSWAPSWRARFTSMWVPTTPTS